MDKVIKNENIGRVKLKSFQMDERRENEVENQYAELNFNEFNLLIGDNAQGKTRLLRIFNFLSTLFSDKPRIISTNFNSIIKFELRNEDEINEISYNISIEPENGKNKYEEMVTKNNKLLFSSKEKYLYNETEQVEIKNYFIPQNIPALVSINDRDFTTINIIRNFFQRLIFISSNKNRDIIVDKHSIIPNQNGTNIASVLNNWSKKYPQIFNEVINEFKECFPFVNNIYFSEQQIPVGILHNHLTFDEKNITFPITQENWSDGLYRMLHLIMSIKVPFSENGNIIHPSLVFIDEIENGLDYKRLKYIVNYLKDYSDESQIIISSHSPLVCDFVHPNNWMIVKRNGVKLNCLSPKFIEDDVEEQLDLFKHKHWEFYTKHISNSNLYLVK